MKVDSINNRVRGISAKSSTARAQQEKANVIIDSLSIAEHSMSSYNKTSFFANSMNSGIGALAMIIPFWLLINKRLNKIMKGATAANISAMAIPPVLLLWGYIDNKNANNNTLAQKTGYYKALSKDLADIESFAILDHEQEQMLKNTDTYKKIKKKYFDSNVYGLKGINLAENMSKIKSDNKKYKKAIKKQPAVNENSEVNNVSELLKIINSRAIRYESKLTQGLNILYAGISALSLILLALISRLGKNSLKQNRLNVVSLIIALAPVFLIGNISNRPSSQDIQNFSKFMSEHDVKSKLSGDGSQSELDKRSIISSFKYYLANRKQVRQQMRREAYLAKYKNFYKKDIELSSDQLKNAEKLKAGFQSALITYLEDDEIDKTSVKRSFLNDFLFNVSIIPVLLSVLRNLIKNQKKSINNNKNLMIATGILTGTSLINTLLAKYLYNNPQK